MKVLLLKAQMFLVGSLKHQQKAQEFTNEHQVSPDYSQGVYCYDRVLETCSRVSVPFPFLSYEVTAVAQMSYSG